MINNTTQAQSSDRLTLPPKSQETKSNFKFHRVDISLHDKTTKKINTSPSPDHESPVNIEKHGFSHTLKELMERKSKGEKLSDGEIRVIEFAKELKKIHQYLEHFPEGRPANEISTPHTLKPQNTGPRTNPPEHAATSNAEPADQTNTSAGTTKHPEVTERHVPDTTTEPHGNVTFKMIPSNQPVKNFLITTDPTS
ncbi:hypothetical protein [Endozoicomonas sp. SCSIO W0465]|uniref:hypothetical protein n=1 Tax=Endozoicomonas sp. SCSIO W0465 TaxID=2918516 RepID=UPI002075F884|nr:hypothetical protein [Endozoicomonas sp. SCSIO W0465]USE34380.1 hypothetical protein MJO57_19790 [Endozoicomonas sp. SCSIO W0465]